MNKKVNSKQNPPLKQLLKYSSGCDQFTIRATRMGTLYVLITVYFKDKTESVVVKNDDDLDKKFFGHVLKLTSKVTESLESRKKAEDPKTLHWKDNSAMEEYYKIEGDGKKNIFLLECLYKGKAIFI